MLLSQQWNDISLEVFLLKQDMSGANGQGMEESPVMEVLGPGVRKNVQIR